MPPSAPSPAFDRPARGYSATRAFSAANLIEEQDAFAPDLAQGIETQPHIGEPWSASMPAAAQGLVGAHGVVQAVFHAAGGDRRRGIDTQPAAPFDPHLVPGMRIALPHY